jgi:hypothetical protein
MWYLKEIDSNGKYRIVDAASSEAAIWSAAARMCAVITANGQKVLASGYKIESK